MKTSKIKPFSELMEAWLYGEKGYYQTHRVGKEGDFYTSVSVSPFFGYCLANYIADFFIKHLHIFSKIAIVEIGADRGYLISDMARFLEQFEFFKNLDFCTIEPLKNLQNTQKETFLKSQNKPLIVLDSLQELQNQNYDFIFFVSNELFDSFACELFFEGEMAYLQDDLLCFKPAPQSILQIARAMDMQIGEIPLGLPSFIHSLSLCAKSFAFLTFDYGAIQPRNAFSLRFYHKHTTKNLFPNPISKTYEANFLESFGKSDMTYEVNFAYLKNLFLQVGAKEILFGRQNKILVDMGLDKVGEWSIKNFGLESFMHHSPKIRTLIDPAIFGERFFGIGFARI